MPHFPATVTCHPKPLILLLVVLVLLPDCPSLFEDGENEGDGIQPGLRLDFERAFGSLLA